MVTTRAIDLGDEDAYLRDVVEQSAITSVTDINTRVLSRYLWVAAGLAVLGLIYALLAMNIRYAALAVGLPVALGVMLVPRLALYQFVFVIYIEFSVIPSIPVELIDLSSLLLIGAATLDLFLDSKLPDRLPKLSLNYLYLILALGICGLFGYWPELAVRRMATLSMLVLVFLSLHRLCRHVSVRELLRWFFVLGVFHAAYTVIPFVLSGGAYRSFGFTWNFFDDQAMAVLPIGLGLFFGASRKRALWYLLGTLTVLGGLVATQSRAPIAMGIVAAGFVLLVAWLRSRREVPLSGQNNLLGFRVRTIMTAGLLLLAIGLTMSGSLLAALFSRFGELLSADAEGTTVYRLVIWKNAILAFADHPIFGIGPGAYSYLREIYPTMHLTPNYFFVSTLSAHNLLLHYLAELGLVGGLGLIALFVNTFRLARRRWLTCSTETLGVSLALYGWAFLFALSILIEASWLWGQLSFLAIFLAATVSRHVGEQDSSITA